MKDLTEVANAVVLEIVAEIKVRSGLKDDWAKIPPEVKIELMDTFTRKVEAILTEEVEMKKTYGGGKK